eukprot:scaffold32493_cov59-Attheya_sp.AAC.1
MSSHRSPVLCWVAGLMRSDSYRISCTPCGHTAMPHNMPLPPRSLCPWKLPSLSPSKTIPYVAFLILTIINLLHYCFPFLLKYNGYRIWSPPLSVNGACKVALAQMP